MAVPGRPSLSLMSTRTVYSPGGISASTMLTPSAWTNGLTRGVKSTFGVRRKMTLTDPGSILAPPNDSNFNCRCRGELTESPGETNSTFGPRMIPRRSVAIAPFGGGSLASSSVINCVARDGPENNRPAATRPSKPVRFILRTPSPHRSSTHATVTDDRVRRPEQRMRVGELGLAFAVEIAGTIDKGHHRLAQGFAARQFWIVRLPLEQISDQLPRRLGMHRPVRHQQGAGSGVEECAAKTGCGLCASTSSGAGVAGGQDDPIRIELEAKNLLHG